MKKILLLIIFFGYGLANAQGKKDLRVLYVGGSHDYNSYGNHEIPKNAVEIRLI